MQINSNTISLNSSDSNFKELEEVVTKIASDNDINNVESVNISLSQEGGHIGFKTAQEEEEAAVDWGSIIDSVMTKSEVPPKEEIGEEIIEEEPIAESTIETTTPIASGQTSTDQIMPSAEQEEIEAMEQPISSQEQQIESAPEQQIREKEVV